MLFDKGPPQEDVGKKSKPARGWLTPALPGSGPTGETCRNCKFLARTESPSGKVFMKCELMKPHWTRGAASDIRASLPACRDFEEER